MIRIAILRAGELEPFPPVESALPEPNGLLAAGGDLSSERLMRAYRHGIFPWFSDDAPILWWSPDPRMVFATDRIHISTRLRRWLRRCRWTIHADRAFAEVVRACAAPRDYSAGTWITPGMFEAYCDLHALGHAHSIEVYDDADRLVGGIYGVAMGRMFFGESMFSAATNGSKVALLALCKGLHAWGFPLLDAQVASEHLYTMGAFEIPRAEFVAYLEANCPLSSTIGSWRQGWPSFSPVNLA
jgi:leucyl/phenylalanyl-tRNA--protein transferase